MLDDNKIQLIKYREGIDKKTSKPYLYHELIPNIEVSSIASLFANLDRIVDLIPPDERWNVHYTNANCKAPELVGVRWKNLRQFSYQEMIPIDLDGIDLTRADDYIRIVIDFLQVEKNKTGVFNSGHGLHFIILLDAPIESVTDLELLQPQYSALCDEINKLIFSNGLTGKADPVRLAESATLRLPNTINRKKDKRGNALPDVMASVIQGNVEPQNFYMDRLVKVMTSAEKVELAAYNVDTQAVLAGCDFLKHCFNNQATLTEPEWYSMLGTLAFIPEIGDELCHTYSNQHPGYDRETTDQKIQQAKGFGRPRLCSSINEVFSGCVSCVNYLKCKTPLQIKGKEYIGTEKTGFHDVLRDSNGVPSKFIPNYVDLVRYFAREHHYCVDKNTRLLYVFNGTHWEERTELEIDAFSTGMFEPTANNTKRNEFRGLLYSSNVVDPTFFTGKTDGYINFKNGILHIATKTLKPHTPEMGFKYTLPYDFNPNATSPAFDQFLKDIMLGDQELGNILLEYMAYAISGMDPFWGQKALIMTGIGSNGKSTLIQTMQDLVGPMCYSTVSLTHMANENMRETLVNKLFNISEEEKYDSLRDSSEFKNIVTGGNSMVKRMYHQPYTTKIMAKLIIGCNEIPPTNDHTQGTYRRLLIIPLRAVFNEKNGNIDLDMKDKIKSEMSGIYNRILEAYERLIKQRRFSSSSVVAAELEKYKSDNDCIAQFAEEVMTLTGDPKDFIMNEQIMAEFNEWSRMNGVQSRYSAIVLSKRLRMMFGNKEVEIRKVAGAAKRGIGGVKLVQRNSVPM